MPEGDTVSTTRLTSSSRSGWTNGRDSIEVRPVVPLPYSRVVFFVLGGDKMSKPQAGRLLPDRRYVDVATIAIKASQLIFLVCLFSLVLSAISGVHMFHPLVATIIMIGCVGFYLMGRLVKQQHNAP
jgi:hypothetical protein